MHHANAIQRGCALSLTHTFCALLPTTTSSGPSFQSSVIRSMLKVLIYSKDSSTDILHHRRVAVLVPCPIGAHVCDLLQYRCLQTQFFHGWDECQLEGKYY
ncbi:hypothetical protein C8Q74DRAFT_197270 [Fomes fomentarius]|nr:hypothetical protein C8Q74DRAFT_197270 [Fomes fomentarius]